MTLPFDIGEAFVLFLVTLGYVPVIRAYSLKRESPWLLAGYTALLLGRVAAVVEGMMYPTVLALVEHGVGIALASILFSVHFYGEWQGETSRYRSRWPDLFQDQEN